LPQSASCSENFVIPPDVFGQTLRANVTTVGRWSFGSLLLDDDAAAALDDRINIEVDCVDD
jgi:hypothetical protein